MQFFLDDFKNTLSYQRRVFKHLFVMVYRTGRYDCRPIHIHFISQIEYEEYIERLYPKWKEQVLAKAAEQKEKVCIWNVYWKLVSY